MISVVIPALDEEKHIGTCLQSLKEQTYAGDYEVIVVDNGSGDGTAAIARNLGATVVGCQGKGIGQVRQVGADAAQGDIIVQADADTIYPPQWLTTIADQFAAHPKAVALSGRYFYTKRPWWAGFEYSFRLGINRSTKVLLGRPLVISGATFAFRRQAFQSVDGYHGLTFSADQYGISSRLSKAGKILFDKNLIVFTSPRRVAKKPVAVLLVNVVTNLGRWNIHLCQQCLKAARKPKGKKETNGGLFQ
jgi:glycosyltransferase involved in cell wall biosynthesis